MEFIFMDIHICGACRTQFNVVEHFIAHKQLCPMLNKMKRQAKIDNGEPEIESRDEDSGGKILHNDLSMILSRGTSINLQTMPCASMSGHSSTPLRQSLQESQNYSESTPESTGIASFQSTFSRCKKHPEVIPHQELEHPNMTNVPLVPEEVDNHKVNSKSDYGHPESSVDPREDHYCGEKRDHPSKNDRYSLAPKRHRDGDRSADQQLKTSYVYQKGSISQPDHQSRQTESFRSPKHRKLHFQSPDSSDQPHMILNPGDFQNEMRFSKEKVKYHLENDQAPLRETVLRKSQSVVYPPQTEQVNYHQPEHIRQVDPQYEHGRNLSRSYQGHPHQNFSEQEPYRRTVETSTIQQHQQNPNISVPEQVQYQQELEVQSLPEDAETLGHHDYYAPHHPEASYTPLENVPIENSPNSDHQYLSSYKPEQGHNQEGEILMSAQRQVRADEAEPVSSSRRSRSRETRQKTTDLDILKQALKSGNVNLEEGEVNETSGDQLTYSNTSNLNTGLPIAPPSNLALLASTLQEHADPLYSSTLVPPDDSILTTDVEMVSVCPIDPMDTEDGTQTPIVTMSQPKYVVVKGTYEKKAEKKGVKEKGGKTRIHECDFKDCDFTSMYAKDIERHIRTHTGEKPFICNYCNKTFNRSDKLKIHIRLHTGEKPFRCSYCEYAAVDSSSLKKHVRTHTDERPFKCQICSYASKNSSQLVVHLRTHTGDSPFQCGVCQAKFKINSDLKRHGRIHTGEKPYKCELCDYRCSIKANLKTHLKINHSEENKITCSQCSFSSSSKKVMREHGKVHDTSTTYECDLCKYISNSKSALATHRRVHSEERPYPCDFCSYKSKQIGNIKTHIKKKHSDRLKHSKYFVRTDKSPEHSSTSNESSPSKNFGRNAYKCNICTASFVRADSLRSHTRQHCRDIAMNLETTALAVLQLQNSAPPRKSDSRTNTKDRTRSESRTSHSGTKVSPRKSSRNQPTKSTCGLQDIADAAVKLSHMPENDTSQVAIETTKPMEQPTMVESQQLIQGQQIIQINQPIRVQQQTPADSTNQVSQIVSLDTQSILNNPDQMVELPNGEWISLKQLIGGQMVTQIPINQQITQYQVPNQTEQQFAVQVIPQQTVQQHIPVSLPGQPQIQIILPSHFINQNQDGGLNTSAMAGNNPQILIQLQDHNSMKPDNQQQAILTSFPEGSQQLIQAAGNLTPLNLQEVVVQMEMPPSGDNTKTGECQSETNRVVTPDTVMKGSRDNVIVKSLAIDTL